MKKNADSTPVGLPYWFIGFLYQFCSFGDETWGQIRHLHNALNVFASKALLIWLWSIVSPSLDCFRYLNIHLFFVARRNKINIFIRERKKQDKGKKVPETKMLLHLPEML
jgi:hypothetical protein